MADTLKVACVQMTSSADIEGNLKKAEHLIRAAVEQGANFVATPENTCHIRSEAELKLESAQAQEDHIGVPFFASLAKELNITLLIGSMTIKHDSKKLLNRSFLFSADGKLSATYDKIHLFDVQLANGETYCESDVMDAGSNAVTSKLNDDFTAGLSICYDLRFAGLYRDLAKGGANILCVPAAFTVPTGKAHWEVLLRARAIETGCYVIAPAQVGEHEGGRKTYGHSMIIDPWGQVLAQKESGEGIIISDINIYQVNKARTAIPALEHDRNYLVV